MQNSTLFRRAAALLLTAALALTLVLPGLAAYEMPIQTVNEGESVYLFNADIDKCKNFKVLETEEPCNECLTECAREGTVKPLKFEEKTRK